MPQNDRPEEQSTFEQQHFSDKTKFELRDKDFVHTIEEKGNIRETIFDYAMLPFETTQQMERNVMVLNFGLLFCGFAIWKIGEAVLADTFWFGLLAYFIMPVGCLLWWWLAAARYTVFSCDAGMVYVLHDTQYEQIMTQLTSRRKKQLIEWLWQVNPETNLEHEVGKYEWLFEQGVLTRLEKDERMLATKQTYAEMHPVVEPEIRH